MTFTSADGRLKLEWVDDEMPDDAGVQYLEARLHVSWSGLDEPVFTYGTLAPTFTPEVLLKRYSEQLFSDLAKVEKGGSYKDTMRSWTWTTNPRSP